MRRIVLHVGPGKCGSSSVQAAILRPATALHDHLAGVLLQPAELLGLDREQPEAAVEDRFHRLIARAQADHPGKVLVLSHEMIFKMVPVLRNLARIARAHADEVVVVAYVRRQSDFLVSAYGQWLFRAPARIAETAAVLRDHGLDPALFWGVERHLIAVLLGGWEVGRQLSGHLYFDWSSSVSERAAALAALGVPLSVGLLPRPGFERPLIADFLARIGLPAEFAAAVEQVRNPGFPPALIEGVCAAIEAGYAMPGPGEHTDFFDFMGTVSADGAGPNETFLAQLKDRVDTAFAPANAAFARQFSLPVSYFAPRRQVTQAQAQDEIWREGGVRAALPEALRQRERAARAALAQMAWAAYRGRGA
ncbi:hypothetical protein [Sinirhodobacter huangdaonensis]|uniref:Sulfotransferase domain-containing protein n=1 Tax=Paenirhodobacter huangdaonensis TaxID=2501515 RepID=A0A3S3LT98_9RHOB|nr:hypothetical protein [Sinirhodobacter huangdaonensis]RWR51747.1 hypothetical protein EOW66_12280 [Sinirhodobacter huangdaonensis]